MSIQKWWISTTKNLPHIQLLFGLAISVSTGITGWKTIQLNEATSENTLQLARIEKRLSVERFGFERVRDIYDRTEKYLMAEQQDIRRGRALVALVSSLPSSQIRADLLAIIAVEAKSDSVAAKAADATAKRDGPRSASKRFFGKIVLEWTSENEYLVIAQEPFGFIDSKGVKWTIPKGTTTTGTSIPRILWPAFGSPLSGNYSAAAVLHEYYSTTKTRTFESVNQMFLEALMELGMTPTQARAMYEAVSKFGPRWAGGETPK
jgi:Protein of unknown function (DUF1353)